LTPLDYFGFGSCSRFACKSILSRGRLKAAEAADFSPGEPLANMVNSVYTQLAGELQHRITRQGKSEMQKA